MLNCCRESKPYASVQLSIMGDMIEMFKILTHRYDATLCIFGSSGTVVTLDS